MGVFDIALQAMDANQSPTYGPKAFREYVGENGIRAEGRTPAYISIDRPMALQPELRSARVMVFRLGQGTFALARFTTPTGWGEYFLDDAALFGGLQPQAFIPSVSYRQLFAFTLLPNFTETSLVNLAVASGLLQVALELDEGTLLPFAPGTGQGTYSFDVRPNLVNGVTWPHEEGQVEIDGVFVGRRGREECVFVLESKSGPLEFLAKHKLVYPVLALKRQIPAYFRVIPVYVRGFVRGGEAHFYVAECRFAGPPDTPVAVSNLEAVPERCGYYVLPGVLARQ
jgi:hypothetical protein